MLLLNIQRKASSSGSYSMIAALVPSHALAVAVAIVRRGSEAPAVTKRRALATALAVDLVHALASVRRSVVAVALAHESAVGMSLEHFTCLQLSFSPTFLTRSCCSASFTFACSTSFSLSISRTASYRSSRSSLSALPWQKQPSSRRPSSWSGETRCHAVYTKEKSATGCEA